MNITFECLSCNSPGRVDWDPAKGTLHCPGCRTRFDSSARCVSDGGLSHCAVCGTKDMYRQKDFPHRLGLAIVGVGIVLSSIAWYHYLYPLAIGVFLMTGLFDLLLYYLIGDVVVCYRCLAQFRGPPGSSKHQAFDLAIGERYRQERIKLEQLNR